MSLRAPWHSVAPVLAPVPLRAIAHYAMHPRSAERSCATLQDALTELLGAGHVVGTDSGTSALRLAIQSSVSAGGVVALPAYGCFDLITAAQGAGCRVVLYDVNPSTLDPDEESLAWALDSGAEAVVVASVFGYVPPMNEIAAVCRARGVALIEDIAQASGAALGDTPLGSWGDLVTLSFGRGKGLGGAGGGALLSRGAVQRQLPHLRAVSSRSAAVGLGTLLAQGVLGHSLLFAVPSAVPALRLGETVYHEPWQPGALHPLQAALAADALRVGAARRAARARVAGELAEALRGQHQVRPIRAVAGTHPGFLRVGVLADDRWVARLKNVGMRRSYPVALPHHPAMRPLLAAERAAPGSELLATSLASLPCHHRVTQADVSWLATQLRDADATERVAP
jgi:dTDP-4-amino-4,6-dideoxygalactose transaminase